MARNESWMVCLLSLLVATEIQTADGAVTYPETLTVSSSGAAADVHGSSMGVYEKTSKTNDGRPVWQSGDRYMFYNGDWTQWVIHDDVSNDLAYIISQERSLDQVPAEGWQFWNGDDWELDDTLTVTGSKCEDNNENCDYWASVGECTKSADYMRENCCAACAGGGAAVSDNTVSNGGIVETEVYSNSAYCNKNRGHTMCRYQGPSSSCSSQTINRKLTADAKQAILDKHNELRRKVAKGEQRGQPKASNMKKLVWNSELESIAQRWVDQCIGGHDGNEDRVKIDGTKVGQNYAQRSNSVKMSESELTGEMTKMTQSWYDEVTDPGFYDSVSSYSFNYGTAHYTQVVWADTEQLGCGMVYTKGYFKKAQLICNYATAGNFQGAAMYKTGQPCSSCPAGYSCDDGLCAK